MAKYKLSTDVNTVIRDDGASIPVNALENIDTQQYQQWLSEGNTPDPVDLAARTEMAFAAVLAKRNSEMQKNVVINGDEYFADETSQNLINQTLSSQERGIEGIFPANWLMANGSIKQVTYDDLKAVNEAIAQRTATNYSNYFNFVQQIVISENPEEIDISQGWSDL